MIRKYEAQKRKYDSLVAAGKQPTWKVTPALTVDLELAKNNISKILETLFETYRQEIANDINFNAKEEMIALVDYFKDNMIQELATQSTETNSLGLAQMLYEQMKRNYGL